VIRTSASRHDHLSSRYPDAITCGMARCGDGASRPHTCGTVSRLVHRGGASGGAGRDGHGSRAGLAVTPGGVGGAWWSRGQHNMSYLATSRRPLAGDAHSHVQPRCPRVSPGMGRPEAVRHHLRRCL
jgi:hypothetical protein